jgi:hypothetical protein
VTLPWTLPQELEGGTYVPGKKRYPAGEITAAGWWHLVNGTRPFMQLKAYDSSITFMLTGGLAPPFHDPTTPECVELKSLKGLIPPWRHIMQKGATQDGSTHVDAIYDPTEVELVVECVGKGWRGKAQVVRDLLASIDANKQSEVGFFDRDAGYWWSMLRWYQGAPPDALNLVNNGQPLSLRLLADDALWRTYDHTAMFGFSYADMIDEFSIDYDGDLGPNWPQYYTGSGAGFSYVGGGAAKWQDDPDRMFFTGSRRVVAGPFRSFYAAADDVDVSFQVNNTPEFTVGTGAANDAWARMGRDVDGNWDGSGVRARIGWGFVRLSVFKDFAEVWHYQSIVAIPPLAGEEFILRCIGRTYSLIRSSSGGTYTMLTRTETGSNLSFMDSDHRGIGFGMQAGGALITQATPAQVRQVVVDGAVIDSFNVTTSNDLGGDWPLRYSGVNDAYVRAVSGSAVWIDNAGTNTQEVVNGPYKDFHTVTDYQVASMVFGSMQEWSLPAGAANDVWVRMGRNVDGSWDGNGVRLRLENNILKLSRCNNFVHTMMRQQVVLVPPLIGEKFTLAAGVEGNPRLFKVYRNGVEAMAFKERDTASLMGVNYRGVGFGMQAGAALITQATPGAMRRIEAGDNSTVSQSGWLERVNVGDQPMYDDYTLFGPGTFKIWDGPGSDEFVEFGPLLDNQTVFLRTDPRSNTTLVQDMTTVPPTPQQLSGFQQAIRKLVSFFSSKNAFTDHFTSMFGIASPQGNFYKYLNGRFSDNSAIPPKSPGAAAKPYYVKVEIDDGNADSKIICSGTPKRRYPL